MDLGLEYIWIDSLCIIQDDTQDWKIQAAQMCDIYRGSYVTIAATCSSSSDDGLFRTIPRLPINGHDLFIYETAQHLYGPAISGMPNAEDDTPLLTRGWVYQERLLSPRVIHFSRWELRFECVNVQPPCECDEDLYWFDKRDHYQGLLDPGSKDVMTRWHETLNRFFTLDLTYFSDYLPAIAGIARQYGTAHRAVLGRYLAGLWENTLAPNLIWHANRGMENSRPGGCSPPTWSWASTKHPETPFSYTRTSDDLEILRVDVHLAGPDEFGPVTSGELVVRGSLAEGSWTWASRSGNNGPLRPSVNFYALSSPTSQHRFHVDYNFFVSGNAGHVAEGSTIYCLRTGFVGDGCHVCLVLRCVDQQRRTFERIGSLQVAPRDEVDSWFQSAQPAEVITLI